MTLQSRHNKIILTRSDFNGKIIEEHVVSTNSTLYNGTDSSGIRKLINYGEVPIFRLAALIFIFLYYLHYFSFLPSFLPSFLLKLIVGIFKDQILLINDGNGCILPMCRDPSSGLKKFSSFSLPRMAAVGIGMYPVKNPNCSPRKNRIALTVLAFNVFLI